ncbi:GRIN1 protein, partial [Crypturellus soui]|nr:GRIN1 protein [Crypturellus soui]
LCSPSRVSLAAPPGAAAGLAWERPSPGMGSAKEPRSLQQLGRAAATEEGCQGGGTGCPPAGDCLPGAHCAARDPSPAPAGSCGTQRSGAAPACGPSGTVEKAAPEPCLKAPGKDVGSLAAPAKHVAFREPDGGAESAACTPTGGQEPTRGEGPPAGGTSPSALSDPPGAAGSETGALRQGGVEGSPAPAPGTESGHQPRTTTLLCESYSFEVTPPEDAGTQDMGTQVDSRASLVSVALSPMSPPDGAAAFTFPKREPGSLAPQPVPSKKDAEMQVSMPVETRSVATGPMTPVAKSPQTSYPEVHVKGAVEEAPEPIREVSWDEKGMTWEVYGASMEVEVLGMAIQKHLEKQIEEHGRQVVVTPQSTRASSVKGAPRKGEAKRPPSVFRALLQNVRRPRCCSRAGPAME